MQRITNPLQVANRHRRLSLKRASLKRRKKAKLASRRAATKANDKIKERRCKASLFCFTGCRISNLTKILIIACNFFRKALRFMQQAAICLERSAGFKRSTCSRRHPGSHNNIYCNSISQCVPKSHTSRLVLHLLPVP